MKNYDVIVIGVGSVGCPASYFFAKERLKVLCLDSNTSPGQGQNKAAIGGIRATHSDPAKIKICQESLKTYSLWHEQTGDDIGWKQGGYCFPVYRQEDERLLKSILPIQKAHGLEIGWVDRQAIQEIVPGINPDRLIGGTFSPNDGQASPLLTAESFVRQARQLGAEFVFGERVIGFETKHNKIYRIKTEKSDYSAELVINTAGIGAEQLCNLVHLNIPINPESHEAGISAPVEHFLGPLVVDLRPEGNTANFYFGQNSKGQIIFCYTPKTAFPGTNREPTSEFLPVVARRLINIVPRFKHLLIRRTWRGLYPMTPDGIPVLGKANEYDNLYLAIGLCGQGFMMGPGLAQNLVNWALKGRPLLGQEVQTLSPNRNFYIQVKEVLK